MISTNFREREKTRQLGISPELFTTEALAMPGTFRKVPYQFCLADAYSEQNLWDGLRSGALDYFDACGIGWHGGFERPGLDGRKHRFPSGHLCDSQSFCVNVWWPFTDQPDRLVRVLQGLGYAAKESLVMTLDKVPRYVAFEWIGQRNYLQEGRAGRPTPDNRRSRGALCTSADAAVRFRRDDGRIQIVLIEWKYTEFYGPKSIRFSNFGTDRQLIYFPSDRPASPLFVPLAGQEDALFFDPFYQLMRLQMLAAAMEREREMDADIVSLLHLVPKANHHLLSYITSQSLAKFGADIHEVWRSIVGNDRFAARYVDSDVLPLVIREAPDPLWAAWMSRRYGGMI